MGDEEPHGEPEEVAEEIELKRGGRAHTDPEGEQEVPEIEPALEEACGHVRRAEPENGAEAVLDGVHADPAEEGRAEIAQTERSAPGRGGRRGRAEGQIENRREQDREQRGERGGEIARREEE